MPIGGTALTYIGAGTPSAAGTYGMSPDGTYLFAAGDENAGITISYQYSSAASFAPNVTPIYDLTDDDFKVENNEDPLQVTRSDPYQAYNVWRLEIAERDNAYNLTSGGIARPERDRALWHAHRRDGDRARNLRSQRRADRRPAHAAARGLHPQHL